MAMELVALLIAETTEHRFGKKRQEDCMQFLCARGVGQFTSHNESAR